MNDSDIRKRFDAQLEIIRELRQAFIDRLQGEYTEAYRATLRNRVRELTEDELRILEWKERP